MGSLGSPLDERTALTDDLELEAPQGNPGWLFALIVVLLLLMAGLILVIGFWFYGWYSLLTNWT